jgi:hypothetical protein
MAARRGPGHCQAQCKGRVYALPRDVPSDGRSGHGDLRLLAWQFQRPANGKDPARPTQNASSHAGDKGPPSIAGETGLTPAIPSHLQLAALHPSGEFKLRGNVLEPRDLSGMVLFSATHGLIGADEGAAVQVFELRRARRELHVVDTILLANDGQELDIEAIAADQAYCYVIGSHGASKVKGELQASRHGLFRISMEDLRSRYSTSPVDSARRVTGNRAVRIERSSLATLLQNDPILGPHFHRPLQQQGVNIEGLAARHGRLVAGLRGPNLGGTAFAIQVNADDLFAEPSDVSYRLHRLAVGRGYGIREAVVAQDRVLLILGNSGSEPSDDHSTSIDFSRGRRTSWRLGAVEGRRWRFWGGSRHPGGRPRPCCCWTRVRGIGRYSFSSTAPKTADRRPTM